jgi:hypothetical protein
MKYYLSIIYLCTFLGFAQPNRVKTTIDTTAIKIGGQATITFSTEVDTLSKVNFPTGLVMGALEVIDDVPTDTLAQDNRYILTKKYGLTQWDSGRYMVPSLPVFINEKMYMTDSVQIKVAHVVVDTLKQALFEIKDVIDPPKSQSNWWIWILVALGVVGVGFGVFYFFFKRNKTTTTAQEFVYQSSIEKAIKSLEQLPTKKHIEKGEIKDYYSELTNIARNYIEETIEIPALESTTNELIQTLRNAIVKKKMLLNAETISHLETVLKQADLVKFAKSKPLEFEIISDTQKISAVLTTLENAIPKVIEEDLEVNPNTIDEIRKRKKTKKIYIGVLIGFFVLINVLGYVVVTQGWDKVVETVFGDRSKELLEKEWLTSTYGNPPVRITTPEVLTRDVSAEKDTIKQSNFENPQYFNFGELKSLQIQIFVTKLKEKKENTLQEAYEMSFKGLESLGANTILIKDENFETENGVKGIRVSGTFLISFEKDADETIKMDYHKLIFEQEGGLQQVLVTYPYEDKYAAKIRKRIIDSVEIGEVK